MFMNEANHICFRGCEPLSREKLPGPETMDHGASHSCNLYLRILTLKSIVV